MQSNSNELYSDDGVPGIVCKFRKKKDICGLDVFLVSIGLWMGDHQVSSGLLDVKWNMGTLLRVMDSFLNSKHVMKSDIWRDYLERGSTWKVWDLGMPKVQRAGGGRKKRLKAGMCAGEKRKKSGGRGKAVRESDVDVGRGEADGWLTMEWRE